MTIRIPPSAIPFEVRKAACEFAREFEHTCNRQAFIEAYFEVYILQQLRLMS